MKKIEIEYTLNDSIWIEVEISNERDDAVIKDVSVESISDFKEHS